MSDPSWEHFEFAGTSEEHRRLLLLEREVYASFADPPFVDCSFQVVVARGQRPQTT